MAAVCIPASRIVELQSFGKLVLVRRIGTVSALLSKGVPAMGTMKVAAAPTWAGWGISTATFVAGGTAGGLAIAASRSSGGGKANRSPSK